MTADQVSDCRRICVTPVRNEAWIIDLFLAAAKTWATDVVVADQRSTDGTLERLQRTAGVSVVINDSPVFDEVHRQRLLLTRAREFAGTRILIALDADEALSANFATSDEWRQLEAAEPGTVLRFRWVNVLPGFERAWIPPGHVALGFVDDGSAHGGARIHNPRLPHPDGAPVLDFHEVVVLHFQYVAWGRMASKQRWYQAWEHVHHRRKSPLQLFREYNHMHGSWERSEIHPLQPEWLAGYEQAGIDFRALPADPTTWWDSEVLQMMQEHGPDRFRRIDLWDKDWNAVAASNGFSAGNFSDPRSSFERLAHRVLRATQANRGSLPVRAFEKLLRSTGW
jgi:hypothetical protein